LERKGREDKIPAFREAKGRKTVKRKAGVPFGEVRIR